MLLRKFEMPWRKAYEAYSAGVWFFCLTGLVFVYYTTTIPELPFYYLSAIALAFMLFNLFHAWDIWRLKWSLGGKGISFISDADLRMKVLPDPNAKKSLPGELYGWLIRRERKKEGRNLWFGKGFDWTPVHTQRVYEIKRADPEQFYPPAWVMWLIEQWTGEQVGAKTEEYIGAPWIHGLNGGEEDIFVPILNLIGNLLLVGTTRCGKTRLLELCAEMAIELGYTVICIDPKGDQPFEASLRVACKQAGREHDFVRFHLAFPTQSVRLDPLKNYTNQSDLASRIAELMPGEGKSNSFKDFAWGVLNAIILGQLYIGDKPSLVSIRSYVDNGVADLLAQVVLKFFDDTLESNWELEVMAFQRTLKQAKGNRKDDGELLVRQSLHLLIEFYVKVIVPRGLKNEAVEALKTIYEHDSAHYSKMVANLIPILGMLTTGDLGALLSPNPRDVNDLRPMTDLSSLIRSNSVVYIGLDALANKTISSAIGSILLSDLTSVAAAIYNYGGSTQKIFLIVDEAAEVVNDPYIQMLNKSAGAGFINVAAIQTIADLESRLGSREKAQQMLGNFNNLVAMRIKDGLTQEYVTETCGKTYVYTQQKIHGTTSSTEQNLTHFTGAVQERVTESYEEVLPPDMLGQLPNWQYVASFSGGRLVKGRLPIIRHDMETEAA
jgi:conjugal transfer pilus assembly protein TraD